MRSTPRLVCSCLGILGLILAVGCQNQSPDAKEVHSGERYPSKNEIAAWVKEHHLREASAREARRTKNLRHSLRDAEATLADARFSVSFIAGELIPLGDSSFSSTSYYSVGDRVTGRELLRVPSTISKELAGEKNRRIEQNVWFLPDGKILLQESWSDGCCAHDTVVLVTPAPSSQEPRLRYLALPEFSGYPGEKARGAYPLGITGDWIIFNPLISDQPFKKKLSEIQDAAPPLPFGIG